MTAALCPVVASWMAIVGVLGFLEMGERRWETTTTMGDGTLGDNGAGRRRKVGMNLSFFCGQMHLEMLLQ